MADRYKEKVNGFRKVMDEVRENVSDLRSDFEQKIADRPMMSVAKAFLVGAVIGGAVGMMMRRR